MARRFTATTDGVTLSLGGLAFTGAITMAAVVRMTFDTSGAAQVYLYAGPSTGSNRYWFGTSGPTNNRLNFRIGNATAAAPTIQILSADGWCLCGLTKAAGTVAPRFFKYAYSTGTWTFENYGSTVADNTTPTGNAYLGNSAAQTDGLRGDIAAVAIWNAALTDAQIVSLATDLSPSNWSGFVTPQGMFIPDQNPSISVVDLTGNGANQTALAGTTATPDEFPLFNASVPDVKRRRYRWLAGIPGRYRKTEANPLYTEWVGASDTNKILAPAAVNCAATVTADLVETAVLAGVVNGAATVTGTVVETAVIAGTANGAATVAAALVEIGRVQPDAAVTCAATVTAALVETAALAGSVNGVATVTASLVETAALAGSANGVATVTVPLVEVARIQPDTGVSASAAVTGKLFADTRISPDAANGFAFVTASLVETAAVTGAVSGVSMVTVTVVETAALAGTANCSAVVTGAVTGGTTVITARDHQDWTPLFVVVHG